MEACRSGGNRPFCTCARDAYEERYTEEEVAAWRQLASDWAKPEAPRIVLDSELSGLPEESAWVLGASNRFGEQVAELLGDQGVAVETGVFRLVEDELIASDRAALAAAMTRFARAS